MNYLIGYKDAERNFGHEDPMLTEYTYGKSGFNTEKLLKIKNGDFLFFHKTMHNKRYITAYYVVEEVALIKNIKQNRLIMNKYDTPHLKRSNINFRHIKKIAETFDIEDIREIIDFDKR